MKSNVPRIILLTLLLVCQANSVWSYTRWRKEKELLDTLLGREIYDPHIRPGQNASDPVMVTVNMYIRGIDNLDEKKMELSAQVTFRQQWKDERLSFQEQPEVTYLTMTDVSRIWIPDPFFANEKSGHFHNILKPNVLVRIYPDGQILYSVRLSLNLRCPMDLKYFPQDQQKCSLIVASYAYTTEDIVFIWRDGDPVQISKNLNTPRLNLEKFITDYCTSRTNTGIYSCIRVDLLFRREFTQYFIQIYLPTILLVVLSWICFAVDHKDITARVVLFASIFMMFSVKLICFSNKIPSVDYRSAYSIWITTCFGFLAAVILKVGYDAFVIRREQKKEAFGLASDANDVLKNKSFEEDSRPHISTLFRFYRRLMRKYPSLQQKSDIFCLILFPFAFTLFNIFYWSFNVQH